MYICVICFIFTAYFGTFFLIYLQFCLGFKSFTMSTQVALSLQRFHLHRFTITLKLSVNEFPALLLDSNIIKVNKEYNLFDKIACNSDKSILVS